MEFTQYLRPYGRKRATEIDMPPEIEVLAERFIAAGGKFECEELSTGHASLTACHEVDGEPQDIAIEIVPNGPEVPDAVARLIRKAASWLNANTKTTTPPTTAMPQAGAIYPKSASEPRTLTTADRGMSFYDCTRCARKLLSGSSTVT